MLRHLRQRVVALIMAMVAIVMTASFSVLYYSTALSYQNQSAEFLRSALRDEPRTPEAPRPSDGPPQPRREAAPVLVLERRADGELLVLKNLISSIEDEDAAFFADLADQTGKQEGMIPSQHLRFQKMELSPGRIRYAMADTFEEERALKNPADPLRRCRGRRTYRILFRFSFPVQTADCPCRSGLETAAAVRS